MYRNHLIYLGVLIQLLTINKAFFLFLNFYIYFSLEDLFLSYSIEFIIKSNAHLFILIEE
jgi:hypothetical protein